MSKDIASGIVITSLIFAVSVYMPIIGFFCALFIPVPVVFYRTKLGRKSGLLMTAATIVVMVIAIGRLSVDVLVFSELMLLGFILSELFAFDLSVEKTVGYASSLVLLIAVFCLILYSGISNTGVTALITGYVGKNLDLTLALYQNMGVSQENIRKISDSMVHIQYVLVRIIPAFAVVSTLFISWTSVLMARPLLKSRNLFFPNFGTLNRWRAPEHLVWGVIGCGLILLVADGGLKMVGLNGLMILMTFYFFQGIAVVSFFFENKNFPRMLRIFFYSLIAIQQFVLLMVIACGFFDMWLNFRRLDTEKSK